MRAGSSRALAFRVRKGPVSNRSTSLHDMCRLNDRNNPHVRCGRIMIRRSSSETPLHPQLVHPVVRNGVGIDVAAFEGLVPVAILVEDPLLDIRPPEQRPAVDGQTVEAERVNLEPRGEAEGFPDVLGALAGAADHEEAVKPVDVVPLGLADGVLHLRQRLPLPEPVEGVACVPASTPKASMPQRASRRSGSCSTPTESTRPSQPQRNWSFPLGAASSCPARAS